MESEDTRLVRRIAEADAMKELYQSLGFKILKAKIEEKITDARHSWLKVKDRDEAEAIRLRASAYQEVYDIITGKILEGEAAKQILKNKQEEII